MTDQPRKILCFTGSRADYGLLTPVLKRLKTDEAFDLRILASGSHLSPEFGWTCQELIDDGYDDLETIEILLSSNTSVGVGKAMGLGLISYTEFLAKAQPDLVLLLGDRFEAMAFAAAALVCQIPMAHVSGGEITAGQIDDAIRHSITKMSHLHFVATDIYQNRIIQMGEPPDRVFNVGEIGLETLRDQPLMSKDELERDINFKIEENTIIVTYHPETIYGENIKAIDALLKVLDERKTSVIFTYSNADMQARDINQKLESFIKTHPQTACGFTHLGRKRYLSVLAYVKAVVGNSSSGIVEAPSFNVATINIGKRQSGRVRADSIIDCDSDYDSISQAFEMLSKQSFQERLKRSKNPYDQVQGLDKMIDVLKTYPLDDILLKSFYDITS